jgi:predicted RNA polymerase sigma factor
LVVFSLTLAQQLMRSWLHWAISRWPKRNATPAKPIAAAMEGARFAKLENHRANKFPQTRSAGLGQPTKKEGKSR